MQCAIVLEEVCTLKNNSVDHILDEMQLTKHNNNHISNEMQLTKYNNNHITFQMRCNQLNIITITSHFQIKWMQQISHLQIRVNSAHILVIMHVIFQSVHSKHNLSFILLLLL